MKDRGTPAKQVDDSNPSMRPPPTLSEALGLRRPVTRKAYESANTAEAYGESSPATPVPVASTPAPAVKPVPVASTPAPAVKPAVSTPAPAVKPAVSTPAPVARRAPVKAVAPVKRTAAPVKHRIPRETDASREARMAAYADWKNSQAAISGGDGFKKGGKIDGCAQRGKTRGKIC